MVLIDRNYKASEIAEIVHLLGAGTRTEAVADFSPGPWWGFNGVQTLVLTADHLHTIQGGIALSRGRLRRSLATADISRVEWRVRRILRREAVRMTITTHDRSWGYTSKYRQATELATVLSGKGPSAPQG